MSKRITEHRNLTIDFMRIICTSWLVYAWHFQEYCGDLNLSNPVFLRLTFGILASFFWISGYVTDSQNLLGQKKGLLFLSKKCERIIPLFLLSAISMYVISMWKRLSYISSLRQLLITIFFVAPIVGQAPSTLWYVDILVIFYLLLCAVRCFVKKKVYIYFGIIYCLLFLLSKFTVFDHRFALYFCFFIWGYVCAIRGGAVVSLEHYTCVHSAFVWNGFYQMFL